MKEKKTAEEPIQDEQMNLDTEESRRAFVTKLASAAGAVLAAGLLTGGSGTAEAAEVTAAPRTAAVRQVGKVTPIAGTQVSYQTLKNGVGLNLSGSQLAETLKREGLMPNAASAAGKVMSIKLEWS